MAKPVQLSRGISSVPWHQYDNPIASLPAPGLPRLPKKFLAECLGWEPLRGTTTCKTKPLRDRNAADAAGLYMFILQIVAAT